LVSAIVGNIYAYQKLKVKSEQEIDTEGNTDLHLAALMGHTEIVYLCDYNSNQNINGATPLMLSCQSNSFESFRYLLNRSDEISLFAKDKEGETISDYICRFASEKFKTELDRRVIQISL
jgi:ankyrin repeat protein